MGDIKVPLAIDDLGKLTRIDDAIRGINYRCPACNMPLIVRKGKINIHHFAHQACDFCSQETVIHKTAKLLIQKLVLDWKNGLTPAPKINRKCRICHSTGLELVIVGNAKNKFLFLLGLIILPFQLQSLQKNQNRGQFSGDIQIQ